MSIYVMVVHKDGHGFALNRNYGIVFKRVENAAGWVRDAKLNGLVDSEWEGWLPGAQQIPEWAAGLPAEEFDAYWFKEGTVAYEHP
jgi:hypothetical protein